MQKQIFKYIDNNQFTSTYLQDELPKSFENLGKVNQVFEEVKSLYHKIKISSLNEGQLETEFIQPILSLLGYYSLYQDNKSILGKKYKIDFTLFSNEDKKKKYIEKEDKSDIEDILLFLESKAYNVSLDNKKVDDTNPHFQLIRYMQSFKINYGFLTNGKYWRFYDITKNVANKVFFQIDLESIILENDNSSFQYFYHIFKKDNFENIDKIQTIIKENEQTKIEIENELKELVYGKNSIVKTIGQSILKKHPNISLDIVFEQSAIFAFRLIFIAYLEDKFENIFFKQHKNYKEYSLRNILDYLKTQENDRFSGYKKIKELFQLLNEGDNDIDIPLLNGGLFDPKKADFLITPKLINNEQLLLILNALLTSDKSLRRDFKTLSVKHIGNIYESLLDFNFRLVTDKVFYVLYKENKKEKDGYFDVYDYNKIKKETILYEEVYEKGEAIFSNSSNSRKETASYYTPPSFTNFIVKEAIDKRLQYDENVLNLKILDNACGSGHFLVDALDYVTEISYKEIEKREELKNLIEEEKSKIYEQIVGVNKDEYIIDELVLLKRILLKNIIYGVDINSLAIEITRLSLWIDTFIFSTPLSFIEHHIKVGNSLIGSSIDELISYLEKQDEKNAIFKKSIDKKMKNLKLEMQKLAYVKDTTKEEIISSKKIYEELKPIIKTINLSLDALTCLKFKNQKILLLDNKDIQNLDILSNLKDIENKDLNEKLTKVRKTYKFFHYEVEFSDAFYDEENAGFNVIVGNPPWDKVKFEDKDFFSMYRSSYRTLNVKEKEEVRENILNYHNVENEYNSKKSFIKNTSEYLKSAYPYNKGSGDSNLFRFFIECNLSLLSKNSSLAYLTPSSLIYEDGSINLRKYIFENFHMDFFYQFENRNKIFNIDSRYKFSVFLIHNVKENCKHIKTRFMQLDDKILKTNSDIINYEKKDIRLLSPDQFMLYQVKSKKDLELLKKFHKKYLTLNKSDYIDFRNEIHLTNDKKILKLNQEKNDLILYEGKMIYQFDSKFEKISILSIIKN